MSSLMDLVAQNQPHFQTHQALLVIGLQNDFVLPDGRLPVNVKKGFLERIQALIPKFRELNGNVIWVQTLYEADRIATDTNTGEGDALVVGGLIDGDESSTEGGDEDLAKDVKDLPPAQSRSSKHKQRALDLLKRVSARRKAIPQEVARASAEQDDELFLLKSEKKTPACIPNTPGAEFADVIARQFELPADIVIKTTNYSAFQGTSLLMTLRARLVTELYICGCITNVSVLATVIDAARHGVKINVVEDCLGFRKQARHDLALKRMEDFFDAYLVNSTEILAREPPATPPQKKSTSPNGSRTGSKGSEKALEALVGKMSLNDDGRPTSRASIRSPTKPTTEPTDERFAEMLVRGAATPGAQEPGRETEKKETNLVKTKIRMRSRPKKKKKEKDGEASKEKSETPVTATETVKPPPITAQKTSSIAKAESAANLRDKEARQQALKSAASVPMLSAKAGNEEKEKHRLSDLSDRVRLSLSRAPKADSTSELKKEVLSTPTKAASARSKVEEQEAKQPREAESQVPIVPEPSPPTPSAKSSTMGKTSKLQSLATLPVLGPGDTIAEGDSRIINDFFPAQFRHPTDPSKPLRDLIFTQLYNEVRWQKMLHQQGEVPRLVCCQGAFGEDGSMPVYRHPTDQILPLLHFSPKVQVIRKQAEKLVGHPLNHVLIQLYRSGNDYISEHSDKTLDIAKDSSIVNVSFGAQRTIRLRTKKSSTKSEDETENSNQRETQRVAMPHNSMFVLGLKSNEKWLHGIMADKRLQCERIEAETAYGGIRISLTFRHIGTFLDAKESTIWGQGATANEQRDAADVINSDEAENERLIRAFSRENHSNEFDWDEWYGEGFDVLHLQKPSEDLPIFFASNDSIENRQSQMCLSECKINYTLVEAPTHEEDYEFDRQVSFRDNDAHHTEVYTASSILFYIDRYYPLDRDERGKPCTAAAYPILLLATGLLKAWLNRHIPDSLASFQNSLASLEEQIFIDGGPFIAGRRFSIADCAVWPIIDDVVEKWEGWNEKTYPALSLYYKTTWKKKACVKKLRDKLPEIKKTTTV
ncbi:uncharacterized protein K460DRAFT_286404 [Cucurbitaria berberidis CBS 394.84]|uniref:Fe2OG dioxygenase domain-containing protein n=1 Tax=Cucurbitaria berberidis CBS 394.84 TaxID=1168544 RepID=A0A9P4GGM3_9PLEO|nr:uncharacterized protein K460DRAFT_286404 [Cucurbitaria berberidis CBS 394.84]KAF1844992.1 hypothetical protein K460DRAFT_286404 [Cucurbitaria berberidis CBS 394.84]